MNRRFVGIALMGLGMLAATGCASQPQHHEDETMARAQRVEVGNADTVTLAPDQRTAERGYTTEALTGRDRNKTQPWHVRRELLTTNGGY